ncbi:MAG: hypothetical protein EBZ50_01180 [Alphaproteobacteria bacterium]|nr:hypothetical protein [Alphaproteobacteria bacterium]
MFSVIVLSSDAAARAKVERHAQSAGARIHCARSSSEAARCARQERNCLMFADIENDLEASVATLSAVRMSPDVDAIVVALNTPATKRPWRFLNAGFDWVIWTTSSPDDFAALFRAARANLTDGAPKTPSARLNG